MQDCFEIYEKKNKSNTEACIAGAHGLSVLGMVFALSGFHDTPPWAAMLLCVPVVVLINIWDNRRWKNYVFFLFLAATVIYLIIFRKWFLTGMYQLVNNGIALINYNYGKEILYYSIPDDLPVDMAYNIFLCYLILLTGMMFRYILESRHIVIFVICSLCVVLAVLFFKDKAGGIACIFTCMAAIGAVMWNNSGAQSGKGLVVYIYTCLAIGLIVSGVYYGAGSYSSNLTVAKMRQSAVESARGFIYGEQDSPQGDLSKAASFVGTESTKLEVSVSTPGVYYLKGYVGGTYKDGVWNEIDPKNYSDSYEGMFHWMEERSFHPLSQNSEYIDIARDRDGFDSERLEMKVDNISANRKYVYIPYGITADSLETFSNVNRDMNILSADRNLKTYNVQFDDYDIAKAFAYENPEWLNLASSDKSINDFRDAQVEYMTFVYDNYLELDSGWKKYFDTTLDKSSVNGYVTITNEIRKWLADKTVGMNDRETKDYLMYFLTKVREGNSSFYASAGVLMYRYYGIPARYVEGYLADVSENSYSDSSEEDGGGIIYDENENGDIIYKKELTGANAHSWVEIYRDGIGWIPVDVTPGFYTELEVTNQVRMRQQEMEREQQEQEENEETEQKKHKVQVISVLRVICLVIAAVCALIIIALFARSRVICYRRSRILRDGDIDRAVPVWSVFVKQLLIYKSMDESEMSGEIIEILQKYRYRDGEISNEDYSRMIDFAYDMQRGIYEKEGKRGKMKMKYVLGLI